MPGKAVQDFILPAAGEGSFRLSNQCGNALVVHFHPKDSTPGRALGGSDFRDRYRAFIKAGAV